MTSDQKNLLTTGQTVATTLETLPATSALPALTTKHAGLKTHLIDLKSFAALQALPIVGRTADRDRLMRQAEEATQVLAGLVLSYATARELGDLSARVQVQASQFTRRRLQDRILLMQQVHAAATEVLPQLADYGVTVASLAEVQTLITAAELQLGTPRAGILARRMATAQLGAGFERLRSLLEDELDPLMASVRKTYPADYALYRAAREVINLPGAAAPAPAAGATAATATANAAPATSVAAASTVAQAA